LKLNNNNREVVNIKFKPSVANKNKNEDKESICFNPLPKLNSFLRLSITSIDVVA
jgi:hypothetical protein